MEDITKINLFGIDSDNNEKQRSSDAEQLLFGYDSLSIHIHHLIKYRRNKNTVVEFTCDCVGYVSKINTLNIFEYMYIYWVIITTR